jgi:integrase
MSIQLFCTACKTSSALDWEACSKCGRAFDRGRKYRVQVSVKGQRVTRVVDNLTIAKELESRIKSYMIRGEFDITHHQAKKVPTLNDLWRQYLTWAQEHKKSWRDDRYYYGKHLQPRFGAKTLDSITALDIEKLKTELRKSVDAQGKPYAAQTIKHQVVILRRLFNLARKWNLYDGKNPVDGVQMPRVDNQRTEYLTGDELSRLLATLDDWPYPETAAFIKFALLTGLRRGELFKLEWNDVDFERLLVTLRNPKGGTTRTLPVNSAALNALRELPTSAPYVFPGENGKQRTDFKGCWQRVRKAAGLPEGFRFHGLRHHFASTLVSNGVDLSVVRELLTHKDMSTTQRYAHLQPDAVRQAARKAGELLQAKQRATVIHLTSKE